MAAPNPAKTREPPGADTASRFQALFRGVAEECNLPPFPAAAARAMALTNDPRAKVEDVARAIGNDPVLAAQVLRLSRSAMFLTRGTPQTLMDAIRTVGLATVHQLLVAASTRSLHPIAADDPTGRALWHHAIATALAADELAQLAGKPRGGEAFMAGLLHDIGKLILFFSDKAAFATLKHFDDPREEQLFGSTHAVVGGALVFRWQLGTNLAEAIVEHHARPVASGLAGEIAKADWIAHRIGCGSPPLATEAVELPGIDVDQLEPVAERTARAFEAERGVFD
jgi:HD-like signal output (HDOD) protein